MKMILFASALALGTAAYAQDATQPAPTTPPMDQSAPAAPDASATPATPDASTPPAAPATPDAGAMPATPNAGTTPATPDAGAAPMTSGATDQGSMAGAQQAAGSVDDSNLPMCSRTVTDKCKQGSGKHGGMHHAIKHRMHKK